MLLFPPISNLLSSPHSINVSLYLSLHQRESGLVLSEVFCHHFLGCDLAYYLLFFFLYLTGNSCERTVLSELSRQKQTTRVFHTSSFSWSIFYPQSTHLCMCFESMKTGTASKQKTCPPRLATATAAKRGSR